MSDTTQPSLISPLAAIRIIGLNRDKTRKVEGTDALYQVYFELSGTPSQAWKNCFDQEWKAVNPASGQQEVGIDREFLIVRCALREVTPFLPMLNKAVAAANKAYDRYVQGQASEQVHREDVWKEERKAVDDMADSLHFG